MRVNINHNENLGEMDLDALQAGTLIEFPQYSTFAMVVLDPSTNKNTVVILHDNDVPEMIEGWLDELDTAQVVGEIESINIEVGSIV